MCKTFVNMTEIYDCVLFCSFIFSLPLKSLFFLRRDAPQPHFRNLTDRNKWKDTSDFRGVSIFRGQTVLFLKERRGVLDSVRGETSGWIPGLRISDLKTWGSTSQHCCFCRSTPSTNNTLFLDGHHRGDWLSTALKQHEELTTALLLFREVWQQRFLIRYVGITSQVMQK